MIFNTKYDIGDFISGNTYRGDDGFHINGTVYQIVIDKEGIKYKTIPSELKESEVREKVEED